MARKQRKTDPAAGLPVSNDGTRPLAPWPMIDRYTINIGSNLSMNYLSAAYRLCQTGYRQNYVDVLDELLEKDPHAYATLWQRINAVCGGKIAIAPAVDKDSPDAERADLIRKTVEQRIGEIPALQMALADLLWGIYYGISAAEIIWDPRPDGWHVKELVFLHSRRLSYPDVTRWDLRIWDQGAVAPTTYNWSPGTQVWQWPTEQFFGIKVEDVPGKFIVFNPHVRGDYPTRDGVGREIAWYMLMKLMAVRSEGQYVERFSRPWVLAKYNTKSKENNGDPRIADEKDIAAADAAVKAMGAGSLNAATVPDSIEIDIKGPAAASSTVGITPGAFVQFINNEISKAVRGATLTTDAGKQGARSLGEVHAEADLRNARYDAACLSESLKRDLVWWMVHLDFPGEEHLCPHVAIQVEERTPAEILKLAADGAAAGMPLDADKVAAAATIAHLLIDPTNQDARRLAPIKPVDIGVLTPQSQREEDVYSALEALAAAAGVSLTNQTLNTLAEIEPEQAAQFLQDLLRKAKQPPPAAPQGQQEGPEAEDVAPAEATQKRPAKAKTKPPKRGAGSKTTPPARATSPEA